MTGGVGADSALTLPGTLRRTATITSLTNPDAGVLTPDDRAPWGRILVEAETLAAQLAELGVPDRGRIGLLADNSVAGVDALFACGLVGAACVPVNTRYRGPEIRRLLADAGVDTVLVAGDPQLAALARAALPELAGAAADPGLAEPATLADTDPEVDGSAGSAGVADAAYPAVGGPAGRAGVAVDTEGYGPAGTDPVDLRIGGLPVLRRAVVVGADEPGFRRVDVAPKTPAPYRLADPDDVALIVYTSGTTTHPRGCPLTHRTLVEAGRAVGRERFRCGPEDVLWDVLPLFHLSFVNPLLAILDAGGTFVTDRRFDAGRALDQIRSAGVTVAFTCFPTVMDALLAHPDFERGFARVRLMLNVGTPETLRAIQSRAPRTVGLTSYGSSEMAGIAATTHPGDLDGTRLGTNGFPLPGIELTVVDPDTRGPLPDGEPGEILARGSGMFTGYLNGDPYDRETWFASGDLGLIDADGRVHYRGRLKDMIKVGGENVAALEVESVLATHPSVLAAAVVAAPDPRYTEVPAAFVELRAGSNVTVEQLQDHCGAALARFKIPRHVRFVTQWPMSTTKIQKGPLRERIARELEEHE